MAVKAKASVEAANAAAGARGGGTPLHRVLEPDGQVVAGARVPAIEPDELRRLYGAMVLIRVLDERMLAMQRQGRIGFFGLTSGQEAAVIGSAAALEARDWVFPALREGGVALLRGYSLEHLVAQCIGNSADILKGRQMPCHYSDRRVNQVAWSSCIGTQLPHAAGAAYAARYLKHDAVMMGCMGDGATSESDFHVALNFAATWRAPVVFFCQNNGWAISVPTSKQTASESIAIKAVAYGMPGVRVDGNDLLAVLQATREAVTRARSGGGPTLIEAVTYRLGGHSSSDDPSKYRDEREVEAWRARDPIVAVRRYMERSRLWDATREESLHRDLKERLEQAILAVEGAPPPAAATLFEDVYGGALPAHLASQRDDLLRETGPQP